MGRTIRSAKNLDGDIEIKITGLRPGEKLYEELLIGEKSFGTEHPKILKAEEISHSFETIEKIVLEFFWANACKISSENLLLAPITLVGLTALSVEIKTKFSSPRS